MIICKNCGASNPLENTICDECSSTLILDDTSSNSPELSLDDDIDSLLDDVLDPTEQTSQPNTSTFDEKKSSKRRFKKPQKPSKKSIIIIVILMVFALIGLRVGFVANNFIKASQSKYDFETLLLDSENTDSLSALMDEHIEDYFTVNSEEYTATMSFPIRNLNANIKSSNFIEVANDMSSKQKLEYLVFSSEESKIFFRVIYFEKYTFDGSADYEIYIEDGILYLSVSNIIIGNEDILYPASYNLFGKNSFVVPISEYLINSKELNTYGLIFDLQLTSSETIDGNLISTFDIKENLGESSKYVSSKSYYTTDQDYVANWIYENEQTNLLIPLSKISSNFKGFEYYYDEDTSRIFFRDYTLGLPVDLSFQLILEPNLESIDVSLSNYMVGDINIDELEMKPFKEHPVFNVSDNFSLTYYDISDMRFSKLPENVEFNSISSNNYYLILNSYIDIIAVVEEIEENMIVEYPDYVFELLSLPGGMGNEISMAISKFEVPPVSTIDLENMISLSQSSTNNLTNFLGAFNESGYNFFIENYAFYFNDIPTYEDVTANRNDVLRDKYEANTGEASSDIAIGEDYHDIQQEDEFTSSHVIMNYSSVTIEDGSDVFYDSEDSIVGIGYSEFSTNGIYTGINLDDAKQLLDENAFEYVRHFDFNTSTLFLEIIASDNTILNLVISKDNTLTYLIVSEQSFFE